MRHKLFEGQLPRIYGLLHRNPHPYQPPMKEQRPRVKEVSNVPTQARLLDSTHLFKGDPVAVYGGRFGITQAKGICCVLRNYASCCSCCPKD